MPLIGFKSIAPFSNKTSFAVTLGTCCVVLLYYLHPAALCDSLYVLPRSSFNYSLSKLSLFWYSGLACLQHIHFATYHI